MVAEDHLLMLWKKFRIAVWGYIQAGLPEWMTFCTWFWLHKIKWKGILRDYTVCTDRLYMKNSQGIQQFTAGLWVCGFAEWNIVTRWLFWSSVCFYWWKWCCWIFCFGCHWSKSEGISYWIAQLCLLDETHWTWELIFVTLCLMFRTMFKLLLKLDLGVFMH